MWNEKGKFRAGASVLSLSNSHLLLSYSSLMWTMERFTKGTDIHALSYLEENLRDYWYCKTLKDKNLDYTPNNKVI